MTKEAEREILLKLEEGVRQSVVAEALPAAFATWAMPLLRQLDAVRSAPSPAAGTDNVFTAGEERRRVIEVALAECNRVAMLPERVDPQVYWDKAAPGIKLTPAELKEKAWCAGFCLWSVKEAGFGALARWDFNGGGMGRDIVQTQQPRPGDIAYFQKPLQHYALIEALSEDMVWLINGNSGGKGIARNVVKRSSVSGFFSIERMLRQPAPSRSSK